MLLSYVSSLWSGRENKSFIYPPQKTVVTIKRLLFALSHLVHRNHIYGSVQLRTLLTIHSMATHSLKQCLYNTSSHFTGTEFN